MDKPRVLITGGAGFIGSHLVESYQDVAREIIVIDDLSSGSLENLEGLNFSFIKGSITDKDLLDKYMKGIDFVYHLAALTSVPESFEKPEEYEIVNVEGLNNVLDSASKHNVTKLILASSSSIYGDNTRESCIFNPKNTYADTKIKGEDIAFRYSILEGGVKTTSLRFFNVFGERQRDNGGYPAAIPIFLKRLSNGDDITIHGDGNQTRDFIYVKDIVEAMIFVANNESFGSYDVGRGIGVSINELVSKMKALLGSNSNVFYGEEREGDIKHSISDTSKLNNLGWSSKYDFDESLEKLIKIYRNDQ